MNTVFSGIRPTGRLHIGNYLGAVKSWLELQNTHKCIFAVVDYHGITTPFDPRKIGKASLDTVLDYLAAGVDPSKSLIIIQSHIPEHLELAWILGSITPLSWLQRIPTYKEKVREHPQYVNLGLLSYPVLMAADILIYKATKVPVGKDQLPHIELTNEIGRRFNSMFTKRDPDIPTHFSGVVEDLTKVSKKRRISRNADICQPLGCRTLRLKPRKDIFPKVEAILGVGPKIMSLQNPLKKMSKTGDEGIALADPPQVIRKKIQKAVTDSGKEIKFAKEKPAISNLLTIYQILTNITKEEAEQRMKGKNYQTFKKELAEVVIEFLRPFQKKRAELAKKPRYVEKILEESAGEAREIAQENLKEVKKVIGLE